MNSNRGRNSMALGKGLKALIKEESDLVSVKTQGENTRLIVELRYDQLIPNADQPRKTFKQEALEELAESIREHGILSPLLVQKQEHGYQIIAGERRWRAARIAGLEKLPAIIENLTDEQILEIALIENIQREDLNIIEEARAYQNLIDHFHYTQAQLAKKIGKSRANVANVLRLNQLPREILEMTAASRLSYGHARALLGIENIEEAISLAEMACDGKMSVRQLEKRVSALKNPQHDRQQEEDPYIEEVQDRLSDWFERPVRLKCKKNKGKIEIPYASFEELDSILQQLGIQEKEI